MAVMIHNSKFIAEPVWGVIAGGTQTRVRYQDSQFELSNLRCAI
ncbi:MAG: hypothetical protein ACI9PY_002565 [Ascidiaceihabitans sp.]|jgi:hypothetical protein